MKMFEQAMHQLGRYVSAIDFFNWGEPLLNPDLPAIISLASSRGIYTTVSSNLSLLPDPKALVQSGLNHLIVSCSGCTQETYAQYHVGGDFEIVMENLRQLLGYRRLNPNLRIDWRFMVFEHNRHELFLLRQRCVELDIGADICPTRVDMREEVLLPEVEKIRKASKWIPSDSPIYDKKRGLRKNRLHSCEIPWTESCIDVDGSVTICCSSYDRQYDLGNILDTPFEQIWNGLAYEKARRYLRGEDAEPDDRVLCCICKDNGFRDY